MNSKFEVKGSNYNIYTAISSYVDQWWDIFKKLLSYTLAGFDLTTYDLTTHFSANRDDITM
jgi:hypothetical protein